MTVCVPVMPAVLINMKVYIYLKMKIDTDRSLHELFFNEHSTFSHCLLHRTSGL
jgi:hypothetical protein